MLGDISWVKNHDFLIDVFKEIHERNNEVVLMLVGVGALEEKIKQKVRDLDLETYVYFLGIRDDIPDLLNLFEAFLFPLWHEGLSVSLIEAQAVGLPCFCSEGNVEQTIITPNVWRWSLEKGAREWAEDILEVMLNYKRRDMQQKIIDANFDIQSTAEEMQEFYITWLKIELIGEKELYG